MAGYERVSCSEVLDYGDADHRYQGEKKLFSDSLRIGTFFFALIVGGSYAPSIILFMAVASSAYNTSRATGGRGSGGTSFHNCDHHVFHMIMGSEKSFFEKAANRTVFLRLYSRKGYKALRYNTEKYCCSSRRKGIT